MSTKANSVLTDVITIKQVPHDLKVFWNDRAKLNSRSMNKEIIRLLEDERLRLLGSMPAIKDKKRIHEDGYEKIGIEETVYLDAIKPFIDEEMAKRNKYPRIIPLKHNGVKKEQRIRGLIPKYEAGQGKREFSARIEAGDYGERFCAEGRR